MKKTFLEYRRPLLCAMVQDDNPTDAICTIVDSLYDGAEAFGIQLCNLKPEYRNKEDITRIFDACEGRPIYITYYRGGHNKGLSDDQCMELLLLGLSCGATLCDVMGDLYHPEPHELTFDKEAVEKQKALIAKIHEQGGEVLISSHLHAFLEEEEILRYAKEQAARGADVVKIVSMANSEEELLADIGICFRLKKELDRPFLFLAGGKHCRLLREIGGSLGSCMILCLQSYKPVSAKVQVQLRAAKAIRDHMLH